MKKISHRSFSLSALLFVGALVTTAIASDKAPDASPSGAMSRDSMKRADSSLIEKAAKSGMEKVTISQIAVVKATHPQVKAFAETMVADHGAANTKLALLASNKGVVLPAKELKDHKWTAKKEGKDFDQEYVEKMIEDHQDAVNLFEKASKSKDADIAAFASATLPKLQHHLAEVKALKKSLK